MRTPNDILERLSLRERYSSVIELMIDNCLSGDVDPVQAAVWLLDRKSFHHIETLQWFTQQIGLPLPGMCYSTLSPGTIFGGKREYFLMGFGNYPIVTIREFNRYTVQLISARGISTYTPGINIWLSTLHTYLREATGYNYRRFLAFIEIGMGPYDAFIGSIE